MSARALTVILSVLAVLAALVLLAVKREPLDADPVLHPHARQLGSTDAAAPSAHGETSARTSALLGSSESSSIDLWVVDTHSRARIDWASASVRNAGGVEVVHRADSGRLSVPLDLPRGGMIVVEARDYFPRLLNGSDVANLVTESGFVLVELAALGRLDVRALSRDGEPAPGVVLRVRPDTKDVQPLPHGWPLFVAPEHAVSSRGGTSQDGRKRIVAATSASGAHTIGGLPVGMPLTVAWSHGATPGKARVVIDPVGRVADLELIIDTGATVTGRFVDERGSPLERSALRAVRLDTQRDRFESKLESGGVFRFKGVPAGVARLTPMLEGGPVFVVEVGSESTNLGDFTVPAPALVTGSVLGAGTTRLVLMVLGERGDRREIFLGRDAAFRFTTVPGPIRLVVRRNGGGVLAETVVVAPETGVEIEVSHARSSSIRFRVPSGWQLDRVHLEPAGVELSRFAIAQLDGRAGPELAARAGSDGAFEVLGVEPGTFDVHVIGRDGSGCTVPDVSIGREAVSDLGMLECGFASVESRYPNGRSLRIVALNGEQHVLESGGTVRVSSGRTLISPLWAGAGLESLAAPILDPGDHKILTGSDPAGRVRGIVHSTTPSRIELRPIGYGNGVPEATRLVAHVGPNGEYLFDGVQAGIVTLCVFPDGRTTYVERTVQVIAGAEVVVDVSVPLADIQLRFLRNGRTLTGLATVDAFAEDGSRVRGHVVGELCHVPLPGAGRYLIAVSGPEVGYLGHDLPEPVVLGQFDHQGGLEGTVTGLHGYLEVKIERGALRPPLAELREWNGHSTHVLGNSYPHLVRHKVGDGVYRFEGLPDDGRVVVQWMDGGGVERRRDCTLVGGVPRQVDWTAN